MTVELEKKLRSMRVGDLRKEISKTNVKGYSKLKKNEIVNLMLKYPKRFMYLVGKEEKIEKLEKMNILKQEPKEEPSTKVEPKKEKPKVENKERKLMKKLVIEFTTKKDQKENLDKINKLMKESKEDDLLANSISKSMLTKFLEEEERFKSKPKEKTEPKKEPEPKKTEPKKEISRLDKLQGDLKVLEKELSNMPSPRAAKTGDGARQIVEMRTKLSSKIANLKLKIFNEKQKQKK